MAFDAGERRFCLALGVVFAAVWIWLAIAPFDREVWLLENVMTLVGVLVMVASYRVFLLSRVSYACVFAFGVLHVVGAHHTYSLTPYDEWTRSLFGFSLNGVLGFERNQFDRLVHFLWGLLLSYPARELFVRMARVRGIWGYAFPLLLVMATSVVYEMIEWFAAVRFGGELGAQYLGTQGDVWDGHKDMALATLGSMGTVAVVLLVNGVLQNDFRAEWRASISAGDTRPMGETALARLVSERRARRAAG